MQIIHHQKIYGRRLSVPDDEWLADIGGYGYFAVTQDYNLHVRPVELAAIRRYDVGCFYLSGAEDTLWATMRVFARGYDHIIKAALEEPRPFVIRVDKLGRLAKIRI